MNRVTVPFFISHRGCLNNCIYCDQRAVNGFQGDLPDSGEIQSKLEKWHSTAGDRPLEAAFFGGSFTALSRAIQESLLHPLQSWRSNGLLTGIRISTRPDAVDEETVQWLADRGVTVIELGIQSMDDAVLERAGRGHTAQDSENALSCIRNGGLQAGAQLIPGLPGDTPGRSLLSLQRVITAGASFIRLYPAVVLKGTELARMYEAGSYVPLSLDTGIRICKILLHTAMKQGVPVIRIGLQPDASLSTDVVLAGCHHPALGQMVRAELYYDLLSQMTSGFPADASIRIFCHPSRISDVTGQGKRNFMRLGSRCRISIEQDKSIEKEYVGILYDNRYIIGDIVNTLNYEIYED